MTLITGSGRALTLGLLVAACWPGAAAADEINQSKGLRKAVTVEGVRDHQRAFQGHSDLNGGNRVAGGPGFEASASYVTDRLREAGYEVRDHFFDFRYNADRTPPTLRQLSPSDSTYVDGVDFSSMTYSASGDVTADVWAVDLVLPPQGTPDNTSTSGCEAADFAGFPAGEIALVQRGTCSFAAKVTNARNAGAVGTIIFNEGNSAGRSGVINGTLGGPGDFLPAVGTTFAVGDDLANGVANGSTGSTARLRVDRVDEVRTTRNVIAERAGTSDDVVVVGAHLDSVPRGAGINDNGSGSAGILEIAEQFAARGIEPRNTVRFMWYSAEEFGLLGSRAYVASLSSAERERIEAMLNFDMIGSPNYVRFVYDGDNSAFPVGPGAAEGPEGSGEIERIFHDFFRSQGLASDETPFSGRSDYGPFIAAGVPAGGLFTGAEGLKTPAQAAVYGGEAGVAYDPCYHLNCDTFANVDLQGLSEMTDAAAHAALTLAKRDLARNPLVNPALPVTGSGGTTSGGGGLHDDHDHEVEAS